MEETNVNKNDETIVNSPAIVENKNENQNQSIILTKSSIDNVNLLSASDCLAFEAFAKRILRSDKGGIKTIEDAYAVAMRAQSLNIPFATSLEHVHVINGKTGIDIHVIKALLLRAGVTWRCLNDYTPLYEYTDSINVYVDESLPDYVVRCKSQKEAEEKSTKEESDKIYVYPVKFYQDFNGNIYRDYQLNANQFAVVANKAQATKAVAEKKIPIVRIPSKPVDYITRYELRRTIDGKEMVAISSFTFSDAQKADLLTKDTYAKYPKILISHRAFSYGARDIASDVILGAYETTELKIMSGVSLTNDDYVDVQ